MLIEDIPFFFYLVASCVLYGPAIQYLARLVVVHLLNILISGCQAFYRIACSFFAHSSGISLTWSPHLCTLDNLASYNRRIAYNKSLEPSNIFHYYLHITQIQHFRECSLAKFPAGKNVPALLEASAKYSLLSYLPRPLPPPRPIHPYWILYLF